MATNNSLNANSVTPLGELIGGTGVSNFFTLTTSIDAIFDQQVNTSSSPVFLEIQAGGVVISDTTIAATGNLFLTSSVPIIQIGTFNDNDILGEFQVCFGDRQSISSFGSFIDSGTEQPIINFVKSRSIISGSRNAVEITDSLGQITWSADDGTDLSSISAGILVQAGGTVSTGIVPGTMGFYTADLDGVLDLALEIDSGQFCTFLNPIATVPPASTSSSLIIGTAFQNPFAYDIVLTVYLAVSSAVSANILLGIDDIATPTQQTIISGLTLSALGIIAIPIYLPASYFALLSTSGTITATISGQQAMAV